MIDPSLITPPNCYWVRRKEPNGEVAALQIAQVSNVFGASPDYWSVAVLGSDQHSSLAEFEFIVEITAPTQVEQI
ncbi:hypothetical protein DTW90_35140 [Neorhizobium sp. P12A]|uniref:hypothetical protein n=1 Tax=Neorhizobium sp. P12A TaxID=2268027 RepID=UPI0011EE813C|nr:hypothetical protein [Neorhizobium sp. P12A]KAA0685621.1 hypothetical protein DTW90_35140 [Neorhizobium sp. P12A]